MKLCLVFVAAQCGHNLPTWPGYLCFLPHSLGSRQMGCAVSPNMTCSLSPVADTPTLLLPPGVTLSSQLHLFNPRLSFSPQLSLCFPLWGLTWCLQPEVTSPFHLYPFWWQLPPPPISVTCGYICLPAGAPEGKSYILGIFVSPPAFSSVSGQWYFKNICWVQEWGNALLLVEELT